MDSKFFAKPTESIWSKMEKRRVVITNQKGANAHRRREAKLWRSLLQNEKYFLIV
jgi:hypothetical protein